MIIAQFFTANYWFSASVFGSLTLYSVSTWLVQLNFSFSIPPYPSTALVEAVSVDDFRAVVSAYIACEVIIGSRALEKSFMYGAHKVAEMLNFVSPRIELVGRFILAICSIEEWYSLFKVGLLNVLSSERRAFASESWLSSNHLVQILVIPLCLLLVHEATVKGRHSALFLLTVLWAPFVVLGGRKELLITLMMCFLLFGAKFSLGAKIMSGLAAAVAFSFPAVRGKDLLLSLNEFMLPQFIQFSYQMGLLSGGAPSDFWRRSLLLVPSWSRPIEIPTFAQSFAATGLTNVGVGGNPFAELQVSFPHAPLSVTFPIELIILMAILKICSKNYPGIALVTGSLLLIHGRNEFWVVIFFGIYMGLLIQLLFTSSRTYKEGRNVFQNGL